MKSYIAKHKERFFDELFSLLRIPSISAKADHKPDMQRCAERLCELLLEAGEGAKTVLPSTAHAKISMRLVPRQKGKKISRLFQEHFRAIAPKYVKVSVREFEGGDGFLIPIASEGYQAASRAMQEVYGIEPVPARGGGSIAVLAALQEILGIDPLLMGFGLERDTIHSPNESYLLRQLFAGMESIALFYRYY